MKNEEPKLEGLAELINQYSSLLLSTKITRYLEHFSVLMHMGISSRSIEEVHLWVCVARLPSAKKDRRVVGAITDWDPWPSGER